MPPNTETAKALLGALQDVATLLERGRAVAIEEQEALVKNDAEALVRTCRAQEEILRRVTECDQVAADAATRVAELAGLDPDKADADSLARAAGAPYAELIADEIDRIGNLARALRQEHETNRTLLENGLEIVACCLRTLAEDPGPNSYSENAALSESRPLVLSLDRRA